MCGIVGLFRPGGLAPSEGGLLAGLCERLAHRGPDSGGVWVDEAAGMALGHRRLSIIDLSPTGAQPMVSASGRYTIVFNGEIYNFGDLRDDLAVRGPAPEWRGHSDTEILLACVEVFGLENTLMRLRGMFAFALYDAKEGALKLVRDAFGEKPLYLGAVEGAFVFASELKAIQAHPAFARRINHQSLVAFVRHGYLGATGSLYEDVAQIAPGSCVTITRNGERSTKQWWDHAKIAADVRRQRFEGSDGDAVQKLDRLIHASIARQSVADVRVGAFLSGGIDSSTIAAIMQAQRPGRIDTFTLGFQEEALNEAPYARDVAHHIGSNHHEIVLTGENARDLVSRMPDIYDEPFADPSQLPTTLIAGFARTSVTVCLSGDGGDELFAGYGRYHAIKRRWSPGGGGFAIRAASVAYAHLMLGLIGSAQAIGIERLFGGGLWPLSLRMQALRSRSQAASALEAYERSFTVTDQAHLFVRDGQSFDDPLVAQIAMHGDWSILEQVTMLDCYRYLPDDILVKVDRAAMSHSLETRVPLLDPDIAAFAWSLSDAQRLMGGERKGILKAVLSRYVPRELWDRPKRGFGIPVATWLRGPFRALADDLFSPARLRRQGLLEERAVTRIWRDFLAGGQRRSNLVWTLFILQLYLDREVR